MGITAGQNFAIAQVLLAVISSVSTCLYSSQGESGDIFRGVVEEYFPWDQETGSGKPKAVANIIYDVFRNPLTHNTGIFVERSESLRYIAKKKYVVGIKRWTNVAERRGVDESWIEAIEVLKDRPSFLSPVLERKPDMYILQVESLYWCTRRMIERICNDSNRMGCAEAFLKTFA